LSYCRSIYVLTDQRGDGLGELAPLSELGEADYCDESEKQLNRLACIPELQYRGVLFLVKLAEGQSDHGRQPREVSRGLATNTVFGKVLSAVEVVATPRTLLGEEPKG